MFLVAFLYLLVGSALGRRGESTLGCRLRLRPDEAHQGQPREL
jgi:hypothetical protein